MAVHGRSSAAHPQSPSRAAAIVALATLVLLAFVSFLDRQIIALMVSPIERDLGITDTQIGLLQGPAFGVLYPLFAIPIGYAADRYSRRWVIFASVMLWAISAMASGLAWNFNTLFAARAGVGLGEAALAPAAASLLSDLFPTRKLATVFSIYGAGSILGSAGALAVGGAVISWAGPGVEAPILGHLEAWQVAFIVTGAPAAILACAIFLIPEPRGGRGAEPLASGPSWGEVADFLGRTWAFLLAYVIGQSLLMLVGLGMWSWQPVILERSFGWTPVYVGSALALFTVLFGFTGQLANGVIVDRMFRRRADAHMRYYLYAAAIVTLSGCLAPLATGPLIYLAVLAPMKFLLNFGGVFTAGLQVVTPSRLRGRLTAISTVITGLIGYSVGPSIVPIFTDKLFHDSSRVIWSAALMTGIFVPLAAICFAVALKPMRAAVRAQEANAAALPDAAATLSPGEEILPAAGR